MTTNQQRAQLHTILDMCIDIENQGIGSTYVAYTDNSIGLLIKIDGYVVFNESIDSDFDIVVDWLSQVATGNLSAIPGYIERLEKMEAEEMENYNKLKEKYESTQTN